VLLRRELLEPNTKVRSGDGPGTRGTDEGPLALDQNWADETCPLSLSATCFGLLIYQAIS
jgi:hypothetical protein